MNVNFDELEDGLLEGVNYRDDRELQLTILDKNDRLVQVIFQGVFHCNISSSRGDGANNNEIWKAEEVIVSTWAKSVFMDSGVFWKEQVIENKYHRVKSVINPDSLRHFILLSDYIDIGIIFTHCLIKIANV